MVEAFEQITMLIGFYDQSGWNTDALEADLKRIHLRLIQKQWEIEEHDAD